MLVFNKRLGFALLFSGSFIFVLFIFVLGLKEKPSQLSLATQNQAMIAFELPDLLTGESLTKKILQTDKAYFLINFWGSWCAYCYDEHAYLLNLSQSETIYGVNWKDSRDDALDFLQRLGNPYRAIMVDEHSQLAIGMGVYGAPETFLVSAEGVILYRYAGPLSASIWQQQFVPRIATLTAKGA